MTGHGKRGPKGGVIDIDDPHGVDTSRDTLREAALNLLRHFHDPQYGGGYAPLGKQSEVDRDVKALQRALESERLREGRLNED